MLFNNIYLTATDRLLSMRYLRKHIYNLYYIGSAPALLIECYTLTQARHKSRSA